MARKKIQPPSVRTDLPMVTPIQQDMQALFMSLPKH